MQDLKNKHGKDELIVRYILGVFSCQKFGLLQKLYEQAPSIASSLTVYVQHK